MTWSFGIINGKLAEIYFEKKKGKFLPFGHAYVKASEYTNRREKTWIQEDTKRIKFVYRLKKYRRLEN